MIMICHFLSEVYMATISKQEMKVVRLPGSTGKDQKLSVSKYATAFLGAKEKSGLAVCSKKGNISSYRKGKSHNKALPY